MTPNRYPHPDDISLVVGELAISLNYLNRIALPPADNTALLPFLQQPHLAGTPPPLSFSPHILPILITTLPQLRDVSV